MITIVLCILVILVSLILINRLFIAGGVCRSKKRLDGKIAIITGANTGIGYETALDFAKRGAQIILACRDMNRAQTAADSIKSKTNNEKIEIEKLDLADLDSIKSFAKKFKSEHDRLDLLINNAGIMMCPYWKTKNGFEMQFGTNHLGHFLLTNLLLDKMKSTPNSRIVNVSSLAHTFCGMNFDDLNSEKSYSPIKAYGQSKLANILFTNELATRLEGTTVTAYSLHPGTVRTELIRYAGEGIFFLIPILLKIVYPFWCLFSKSPKEGAQTTIYCAITDEAFKYNGCYFSDCKPKTPSKHARNKESAKKLWEISAKLVGLE